MVTGRVCAVLVTRGDVDMTPIVASLPEQWQVVIWDNSRRPADLSVYGRYAGIADTECEWIYVQDDDVIVSVPESLLAALDGRRDRAVCNMPQAWREQSFYNHHALVGFGAAFHRDLPAAAFARYRTYTQPDFDPVHGAISDIGARFSRCCDIVFTALVDRELVDVPYRNLSYATAAYRMYRQPTHLGERIEALKLARAAAAKAVAA